MSNNGTVLNKEYNEITLDTHSGKRTIKGSVRYNLKDTRIERHMKKASPKTET